MHYQVVGTLFYAQTHISSGEPHGFRGGFPINLATVTEKLTDTAAITMCLSVRGKATLSSHVFERKD